MLGQQVGERNGAAGGVEDVLGREATRRRSVRFLFVPGPER
jgi:hypothetical protein